MKIKIIILIAIIFMLSSCFQSTGNLTQTELIETQSENATKQKDTEGELLTNGGTFAEEDISISEKEKTICEEAATKLYANGLFNFKAEDTIHIDDVMQYYKLFMMRDNSGNLFSELVRYRTGENLYEIRVPKEKVKASLQSLFHSALDDTSSIYEDPTDSNFYILDAEISSNIFTKGVSYIRKDGIIEVRCVAGWVDPEPTSGDGYNVQKEFTLGLKITDGLYEYVYCILQD